VALLEDTWSAQANVYTMACSGRIRNGYVTPHFGALAKDAKPVNHYVDIRKGGINNRRYTQYYTVGPQGPFYAYNNVNFFVGDTYNSLMDSYIDTRTPWASKRSDAENACMVGALVKMADAKVNIAVALAEASKTSDLIYDTARRIDRAYRAFRKGDLRGIANNLNITPKKLHKSWLEYKYGWMPLLMDVKGAAEFFAQQHVERPPKFKVTKRESITEQYRTVDMFPTYGGGADHEDVTNAICNYDVRVTYWCELSYPHLAALQQIGVTNPALVAWELVPYSFVFDWFIQVGDWLTALTAQNGVSVRRVCYSTTEDLKYSNSSPPTTRSDVSYGYFQSGGDRVAFRRTYIRAPSVPSQGPLYPPRANSFGFAKLVTSLALLKGSYRGNARV